MSAEMTLEQVIASATAKEFAGGLPMMCLSVNAWNCLLAHLAKAGEPVAWHKWHPYNPKYLMLSNHWHEGWGALYAAPPSAEPGQTLEEVDDEAIEKALRVLHGSHHYRKNGIAWEDARTVLEMGAALAHPRPTGDGMVSVVAEDANNYCRILTVLGMEEEGDPVAEIERLIALAEASTVEQAGWKLVPVEPTDAMRIAGRNAHNEADYRATKEHHLGGMGMTLRANRAVHTFSAMLAAAPAPGKGGE